MAEVGITRIGDVYLEIDGDKKYPVAAFSTGFAVDSIPICSVTMAFGMSLQADTKQVTGEAFLESLDLGSKETLASLYMTVNGVQNIMFHGVILYAEYATSSNGTGSAKMQVQVTIQHIAGRWFTQTLSGFTYMLEDSAHRHQTLQEAKQVLYRPGEAFQGPGPIAALANFGSGTKDTVPNVSKFIKDLMGKAYDIIAQISKTSGDDFRRKEYMDYIRGGFNLADISYNHLYGMQFSQLFAQNMSQTDALSSLINTCNSGGFMLHVVPNSVYSVEIMPSTAFDLTFVNPYPAEDVVSISIHAPLAMNVRGADKIVVCGVPSAYYNGTPTRTPIIGQYPVGKDINAVRKVISAQAPTWISGIVPIADKKAEQGKTGAQKPKESDKAPVLPDTIKCANQYARALYLHQAYSNVTASVTLTTPKFLTDGAYNDKSLHISDYMFLGEQVKVDPTVSSTVNPLSKDAKLIGTLHAVHINFQGNPGSSTLYITEQLTDVHDEKAQEKHGMKGNPLYVEG